jgi:hypothetical protein
MANEEHVVQIKRGVKVWNTWREENPDIVPDLCDANLSNTWLPGADLSYTYLRDADLSGALLTSANLSGTDFTGAYLSNADLREANLGDALLTSAKLGVADFIRANLNTADLRSADLHGAHLNEAKLCGADLRAATLIDSHFDGADLTGAKLWETQRGGWSIKDVTCQQAFWDRDGKEPTEYEDGAFERIFAEKPRIVLRYPGSISPIDLVALPLIIKRLQTEYPDTALRIRSVQDDAGGASVTIVVEDLAGRSTQTFEQELVRLQVKLECVVEERDHLRQLLGPTFLEGISKIGEFLALPRQEIHVHRPSGLTAIESPTMSRDTYNIHGQTGAVGRNAHAHDMTFQQVWSQSSIDLPRLAEELKRLRAAMKEADGKDGQDEAIGAVAAAEKAAIKGDGPTTLQHLKTAGKWTLGIAEKIGVPLAVEAMKRMM